MLAVTEQFLAGAGCDDDRSANRQVWPWLDGEAGDDGDAVQAAVAALDGSGVWLTGRGGIGVRV